MSIFQYNRDASGIVTLSLDMPGRSANVMNDDFGLGLGAAVDLLAKDIDSITGIIVTSNKKTFLAGADIDAVYKATDAKITFEVAESIKAAFRKLETLGKPVVAAINGSAIGGGYELALACHYRITMNDPKIRIGLPEVQLGVIPGGGGVVKLTWLLGLQTAFSILSEGKRYKVGEALKHGLIDAVADSFEQMILMAKKWIAEHPNATQPWDTKGYKIPGGKPTHPKVAQMLSIAPAIMNKKTKGNYPNIQAILNVIVEGAQVDFDTAMRIESRYFTASVISPTAKNMITAFWYNLNDINRGKSRPEGIPPHQIKKVGMLGAGMMGAGIAYVSAYAGIEVVLKDISIENARKGKAYSEKLLAKRVSRGKMSEAEMNTILDRIHPTENAEDLKGCDLIVEAVFEDRALKASVTIEAEAMVGEQAIFASNTSTLPITGLAEASRRPANFIGLHFFSPVDKMKLVEIIVGEKTSPETLAKSFDYVKQINKTPIVVNDSRGFYTSRVFSTYVQEGASLLAEGQHPRMIESAGLKAGMPVGPLALLDEVSIKLVWDIARQTEKDMIAAGKTYQKHPSYPVMQAMNEQFDRKGKAYGAGFYEYPEGGKKFLWPELKNHFPLQGDALTLETMIDRMMFIQAIETVRCMEEGVIQSVADANIGSIFGWGFAPFKGGTLQFINEMGPKAFVARAQELESRFGARFQVPGLLLKKAETGEKF